VSRHVSNKTKKVRNGRKARDFYNGAIRCSQWSLEHLEDLMEIEGVYLNKHA